VAVQTEVAVEIDTLAVIQDKALKAAIRERGSPSKVEISF
jgi:hypothetical protein